MTTPPKNEFRIPFKWNLEDEEENPSNNSVRQVELGVKQELHSLFSIFESDSQTLSSFTSVPQLMSGHQSYDQKTHDIKQQLNNLAERVNQTKDEFKDIKLEQRKTELATCMQLAGTDNPYGSFQCLENASRGLTKEQEKELVEFLPNIHQGIAINTIAAPFAAISKVTKALLSGLYYIGVSNGCVEMEPHDIQGCMLRMTGDDPEFNQALYESLPNIAKNALEALEEFDEKMNQWDQTLQNQYRTIPGIVHEGSEGLIDVGVTFVSGPIGYASKGAFKQVLKKTGTYVNRFKDHREVRTVTNILSKKNMSIIDDMPIDLTTKTKNVERVLKDYSAGTQHQSNATFIESFSKRMDRSYKLRNSKDELPFIARGKSQSSVFFVKDIEGQFPYVMKIYPALTSSNGQFAKEILSYELYKKLNLKHLEFPKILKVGKYHPKGTRHQKGLMLMTRVKGKSLATELDEISKYSLGSTCRLEKLKLYTNSMKKVGISFGEFHNKSFSTNRLASPHFIQKDVSTLKMLFKYYKPTLDKMNVHLPLTNKELESVIHKFKMNPGEASFSHGDAHLPNFHWDSKHSKLYAFDTSHLIHSLNHNLHPIGASARDYIQWHEMLNGYGSQVGLTQKEISLLQDSFRKGYQLEFNLNHHTHEAHRFYIIYWNFRRLNVIFKSDKPALHEIHEVVERIIK